tara:strand:+ start:76 stop:423 length:348 start_codon:yes stop_codon:yes gene_type:complete
MKKFTLIINKNFNNKDREIFFVKKELQVIFNLYSKMVSNGTWRDYSLSSDKKEISFDVYKTTSDKPILRIAKNLCPKYFNEKFLIKDKNGKIIKKSENLKLLIRKTNWGNLKIIK